MDSDYLMRLYSIVMFSLQGNKSEFKMFMENS